MSIEMSPQTDNNNNLLDKLGFTQDTIALIIHCDDVGVCLDANRGSFEAIEKGVATSGSIMMPCPWAYHACQHAVDNPTLDLGIHLTLTCEWDYYKWGPICDKADVPSLIKSDAFMPHKVHEVVAHANVAEVKKELVAQIERALEFDLKPTHIDTHMATLFGTEALMEVYIDLGITYDLPLMTIEFNALNLAKIHSMIPSAEPMPDTLSQKLVQHGKPILDGFIGASFEPDYDKHYENYRKQILSLTPGVHQFVIHPMADSSEGRTVARTWEGRNNDRRFCLDPKTRDLIEEQGIKLINWRDIQAAMK